MGASKQIYECIREHNLACMALELSVNTPWIKFHTSHVDCTSYTTDFGRSFLVAWCSGHNTDQGFYAHYPETDFYLSEILPIPKDCDVWLGMQMVYQKGKL